MDRTWLDQAAKLVDRQVHLAVTSADPWVRLMARAPFCGLVVMVNRAVGMGLQLYGEDGLRVPPDLSTFEWDSSRELRDDPDRWAS